MLVSYVDKRAPQRYVVDLLVGWPITDRSTAGAGALEPGTTAAVLDRFDCYREVGVFASRRGVAPASAIRAATRLAADLNFRERVWERAHGL